MENNPASPGEQVKIEAKSLELALVKAAGALGATQDEIEYKVLREDTSKGLFSFFKTPVVEISAWLARKPARRPSRSSARPRSGDASNYVSARTDDSDSHVEPLSPEKINALIDELRGFCAGICTKIVGEEVEVKAEVHDGRLVLDIESELMAQQFTKNTKLAEAMEHILRKKPRHLRQELPFRIFVDVSGLRRKREEDLIQMAFDLSAKVYENRRPIVLNYKSSYDRKIIHMALDRDDRVYTKSIGSGPNRKLMILPSKDMQPTESI